MKDLLKYLAIVLIAAAAICAFFGMRGCKENAALLKEHESILKMQSDTIRYYRDHAGREHAMRMTAEASLSTLKAHYGRAIDSITRAIGVKPKQVDRITTVGTQAEGKVTVRVDTVIVGDSSTQYHLQYADRWLYLDGVFDGDLHLNYLFEDSIVLSEYWRRKWLLGRKQYYIDGYSLNPNVHITGLSSVRVARNIPGRIGIGPFVGYGYGSGGWQWGAGLSVHYSLIRF